MMVCMAWFYKIDETLNSQIYQNILNNDTNTCEQGAIQLQLFNKK